MSVMASGKGNQFNFQQIPVSTKLEQAHGLEKRIQEMVALA
jgi:hypothetical protein